MNRPGPSIEGPLSSAGRRLLESWARAARALDSLLFPGYCPVCETETGGPPFCEACRGDLLGASWRACQRCSMPVGPYADREGGCPECRGRSLGFDRALALGPYQGPIRSLCLALKHERNAWIGRWLGELVAEGRLEELQAEIDAGRRNGREPWIVPVPLHWRRRLGRGYNQSEALAVGLGRALGVPVKPALRRVLSTPKLARLGRLERSELMKRAFRARPFRAGLQSRTVLLVDDILTSGATSGAAARALKRAGASRVVVVVVARAEGKP